MAVVSVNERYQQRRSSMSDDQRRKVRVFHVHVDSMDDGPEAARTATDVPQVGDQHPTDPYVRAVSVEPEMIDGDPFHYDVRVEYSTRPLRDRRDLSTGPEFENPLARPAEIYYGQSSSTEAIHEAYAIDIAGSVIPSNTARDKPILNTAGQTFDPPVEMDANRPMIRIVRNEAAYDNALAVSYVDNVNSVTFLGASPGTVKVASITAIRVYECNLFFWRVTYEFHYRAEGWRKKILNQGFEARPAVDEPAERVLDANGIAVSEPVLLAVDGTRLAETATAVFIEAQIYKETDLTNLNITL